MNDNDRIDLGEARERFAASTDFTIGIEEEFAIVDPTTLDLVDRYEDFARAAADDDVLRDSLAGELIASEVEIRSGRAENMAVALQLQGERRRRLFELAGELGVELAATGTHPWANYLDQVIIDTPHYQRLKHDLGWVAQRNNTWSLHVHVGIQGADRAIRVCDWVRQELPLLLAVSGNSPFLDRIDTGLASVRTEIFTKIFPRCGVPSPFGDWEGYSDFISLLVDTGSVVESTQIWWSVRPHHAFGTVEIRICDAQATADESSALAGLMVALVAQTAIDLDSGRLEGHSLLSDREIDENLWRAIRYGMDGRLIDFAAGREIETAEALDRLLERTAEARDSLGIQVELPGRNGAQRARDLLGEGLDIEAVYREFARSTAATFGRPA
jgi:glutamate---cysteine ligase / carboxylate-amine ligase